MSRSHAWRALCVVGVIVPVMSACGSAASSSSPNSPIIMGEFFSLTGRGASPGTFTLHGAQTAVAEVNANGGVMGHPIKGVFGDAQGDAVDAVPAWGQL